MFTIIFNFSLSHNPAAFALKVIIKENPLLVSSFPNSIEL